MVEPLVTDNQQPERGQAQQDLIGRDETWYMRILQSIAESPILVLNSLFIALWATIIFEANNDHLGFYNSVIKVFGFSGIIELLGTIIVIAIWAIPGFLLVLLCESWIKNVSLSYFSSAAINIASICAVVFIIYAFIGDYGDVKRHESLKTGQEKAKVLIALQNSECDSADKHYQVYKSAKGDDHAHIAFYIAACMREHGLAEQANEYLDIYFANVSSDDELYQQAKNL